MDHDRRAARRRLALAALGAALLPPLASLPQRAIAQVGRPLAPTPADVEGPFYPMRLPADRDFDLTVVAGRPGVAQGTRLYLDGRVLDTRGRALPDARVELWQCDAFGHYHHVDGDRPADPDFQGYGQVLTDGEGRYRFKTIRPVAYGSRPPHLHFKVAHAAALPLTTQLYVKGDGDAGDPVGTRADRRSRERRMLSPVPRRDGEAGALAAEFDFVLVLRAG